jgi:nitrate reductase NapAB chaperone NapD
LLKLKSKFGEFVTIYDELGKEIVVFQSDEIDMLEESLSKLLNYLTIKYEFIERNN